MVVLDGSASDSREMAMFEKRLLRLRANDLCTDNKPMSRESCSR